MQRRCLIGLIACGKAKRTVPAMAKDLYIGSLFQMARRVVELRCREWGILSAKHGLLAPDRVIAPYDMTLQDFTKAEREAWTERTREQIRTKWDQGSILLLAGSRYASAVDGFQNGEVWTPLKGLAIGKQLQMLKRLEGR